MLRHATVIDSQERLARINDGMVAAGVAEKHDARRHLRQLRRAATPEKPKPATPEGMAAMGFPIVTVKRGE